MSKHFSTGSGSIKPCDPKRATNKFEVTLPDGTVHPYVFRSEADAQAFLDSKKPANESASDAK